MESEDKAKTTVSIHPTMQTRHGINSEGGKRKSLPAEQPEVSNRKREEEKGRNRRKEETAG